MFFALCTLHLAQPLHAEGTIDGIVVFPGETPPRAMFTNHDDPDCPAGIAQNHLRVRQDSLGLQNALVILDSPEVRAPHPTPIEVVFERCTILPRVQWAPSGASLALVNKDRSTHRIQAQNNAVTFIDEELRALGPVVHRPLLHAGFNRLQCGRHLWERAWIYVSPHPYVAVTGDGGHFRISHVPAGHYAIRAWHEGWTDSQKEDSGRQKLQPMQDLRTITVKNDRTTTVRFDNLQPSF